MKTNKKVVLILSLMCVLLALLLAFSISFAYFGRNRKFFGTLNFSNGIKLNYYNAQPSGEKSFTLLKLGNARTFASFESVSDLTPLNEAQEDVKSEEVFYLANPYITANSESIDCFVRFKLEFKTREYSETRLMTDEEVVNVFGTSNPVEYNLVGEENIGFLKKGDYFYLVNAGTEEILDYSDLYKLTNADENAFYLFEKELYKTAKDENEEDVDVYYYTLRLADMVDVYLVKNFEIEITIETIDGRDGNAIQTDDIWQIK